jgi:hypothetical protein
MKPLLEKQMPPKAFYVLGMNWYCYVEPSESDLSLDNEDLLTEVCAKAVEVYLGLRHNDTLTIMDTEIEPMIGILFAVTIKGQEDADNSYQYVPSYMALANAGRYRESLVAKQAYDKFIADLDATIGGTKKSKLKQDEPIAIPAKVPRKPRKKKNPPKE